jgi:hypothetical protein
MKGERTCCGCFELRAGVCACVMRIGIAQLHPSTPLLPLLVLPLLLLLPCVHSGDSITHDRQGLMLCDMATAKWAIYLVNEAWHRTTGISHEMAAGGHFWDLFEPPAPAQVRFACLILPCGKI